MIDALFSPSPPAKEQMEMIREMYRNNELTQSQINLLNAAKFRWVSVEEGIQKLIDFNASTNGWDISKADNPKDISNIANDIRELKKRKMRSHMSK